MTPVTASVYCERCERPSTADSWGRCLWCHHPLEARYLTCTGCKDTLRVGEVPHGWIGARDYRCGECGTADASPAEAPEPPIRGLQPRAEASERAPYDPATAPIPY